MQNELLIEIPRSKGDHSWCVSRAIQNDTKHTKRNESFFFLKYTISKFLVNNEILTIDYQERKFFSSRKENRIVFFYSYFNFIIYRFLVNRGRSIHSVKNTRNIRNSVRVFTLPFISIRIFATKRAGNSN